MKRALLIVVALVVGAVACSQGDQAGQLTLVVLGDSLTAPVGTGEADWLRSADPDQRFSLLANAGVPGDRTDQVLARVEPEVIVRGPRWATVLAGTNDIGQHVDAMTIIANLTAIYDELTAAGVGLIAITVPPMSTADPAQIESLQAVNGWMREHVTVDWPGAVLADWSAALSVNGDGITPVPEYYSDVVHIDADGARVGGQALRAAFASVSAAPVE